VIKEISVQVSVKHNNLGNRIIQQFTMLGSKKNWRYLLDSRFYIKKIFDSEIIERGLTLKNQNFIFEGKVENENVIEILYTANTKNKVLLNDYYFTVHDFVPTTFGCEFCSFDKGEIDEEIVQCDFFRKPTKRRKGSCKYFNQKRLFKT